VISSFLTRICTTPSHPSLSPEDENRSSFANAALFSEYQDDEESPKTQQRNLMYFPKTNNTLYTCYRFARIAVEHHILFPLKRRKIICEVEKKGRNN
jgi:hypothetical protein